MAVQTQILTEMLSCTELNKYRGFGAWNAYPFASWKGELLLTTTDIQPEIFSFYLYKKHKTYHEWIHNFPKSIIFQVSISFPNLNRTFNLQNVCYRIFLSWKSFLISEMKVWTVMKFLNSHGMKRKLALSFKMF